MMKAVVVHKHGDLDALELEERPDPRAEAGQVLVEVRACGVNHLDVWVRRGVPGHTFALPLIPGSDVAGVVRAVGPGVSHVAPLDEVVVAPGVSCGHCKACLCGRDQHCSQYGILGEHRDGGYAELLAVPAANVVAKPQQLSFEQAAAVGVAFLTAWHMLVARAQVQPGETVLVQAAGSGVGSAAVQVAKLWGAEVIATARGTHKLARARELGADHLVDYTTGEVHKEVRKITAGKGCAIVIEHVGATTWTQSLRALGWQGRLVTCGATTGADVQVNLRHLFFKAQSVLGSTMGSKGEFCEVIEHVARGALTPVVDHVLPLSQAREAHRLLEAREVFGKIVLKPEGS